MQQFKESLKTVDLNSAHNAVFKKLQSFTSHVNDEIEINSSGNVKLSTIQVTASELQSLSQEIIERSLDSFSLSVEKAVNRLIDEIRQTSPVHLFSRMSANLSALHGQQLKKGEHFGLVRETIAIWLLVEDIDLYHYPKVTDSDYKFHFEMYKRGMEICLPKSPHLHIVQMNRWRKPKNSTTQPLDYWANRVKLVNTWS